MKKNLITFALFVVMLMTSVNLVSAIWLTGVWNSNGGQTITIANGQQTDFQYSVSAYSGNYRVELIREGNPVPIKTYIPTTNLNDLAYGTIMVTPADYESVAGTYFINISGSDTFDPNGRHHELMLTVTGTAAQLDVSGIVCASTLVVGQTQTCTITVSSGSAPVSGADITVYIDDGSSTATMGTCTTDATGSCNVNQVMNTLGTYTVYAHALATGYTGDFDQTPSVTFTVTNPTGVTCTATPTNGGAPLTVTFDADATGGSGTYTNYAWDFADGTQYSSAVDVPVTKIYAIPGIYAALVTVTDSTGATFATTCPAVTVLNFAVLAANPQGPYAGYMNEPVTFDGSLSTGNITQYVWDFGDGNITTTTSPTVQYTYLNKIGTYRVTLTVFDNVGNNATGSTTATITERTNYKVDEDKERIDGTFIGRISMYGNAGEIFRSTDDLTTAIDIENNNGRLMEDARVTVEITDLGIQQKSSAFDIRNGEKKTITVTTPLYDVPPGTYYVKVTVSDDHSRRTKYRDIVVQ